MIHYAEMNRPKDINQPSPNEIVEGIRQAALNLAANFGVNARNTRAYRAIFSLLPDNATTQDLHNAVKTVDRAFLPRRKTVKQ